MSKPARAAAGGGEVMGEKLTKAQRRVLEKFGVPGTYGLVCGHAYAPPQHLETKGLIARVGYQREGILYRLTPAGRAALSGGTQDGASVQKDPSHD
jgi:hypothetical protein